MRTRGSRPRKDSLNFEYGACAEEFDFISAFFYTVFREK
jgi:hypothetical protein